MYKYIIVDDEEILRKGIRKKVSALSLPLIYAGEAENGEDAIQLMEREKPDIVITDMRMPVLDGKMLLKVIQSVFPACKVLVISGFTDFEYLQEAISANVVGYLLKPFNREEIQKSLEKAISLLEKDKVLVEGKVRLESEKEDLNYTLDIQKLEDSLLGHKTVSRQELRSQRLQAALEDSSHYTAVLTFLPMDLSEEQFQGHQASLSPEDAIIPVFNSSFGQNTVLFLCFHGTKEIRNFPEEIIRKINTAFYPFAQRDLLLGISSCKTNLDALNEAYRECILSLDARIASKASGTYFFKEGIRPPRAVSWVYEDQLLFHIEAGNEEKTIQLINMLFNFFLEDSALTLADVKYNCKLLYNAVRSLLNDRYLSSGRANLTSGFDAAANGFFTMDSIRLYFSGVLANVSHTMKGLNIYPEDDLVSGIKRYLEQNYTREISLQKLSTLFFINPSYCSFLFKQKTGLNISDYITGLRMEKAKKMLLETSNEIYSIAKMLGYNNTKYFFRVFKRVVGTTPENYRQLRKQ